MTVALALPDLLPGVLHEHGVDLPPNMPFEQWHRALVTAEFLERASPWFLVDLIEYGRRRFGEDHTQAFPDAQEDPSGSRQAKLKQAAWMADRWPVGTRVPGASYTHHRIVAKLDRDEAVGLLGAATEANWSTRELAREVEARERAIPASATVEAPTCAADRQGWIPSKDDLLPEHQRALEGAVLDADVDDPAAFVAGALWMARYTASEALFREDRWRDE